MSTSTARGAVEDIYESQNDQRLDELHSKLRTLRGVTNDIHGDVEAQNLILDETGDRFSSFGAQLGQSAQRAGAVFGIGTKVKVGRVAGGLVGLFLAVWAMRRLGAWLWGGET